MCDRQDVLCLGNLKSPAVLLNEHSEASKWQPAILNCMNDGLRCQWAWRFEVQKHWTSLFVLERDRWLVHQVGQELASTLFSLACLSPKVDAIEVD